MAKFHVNPKTGNPGECRAEQGGCPFGGEEHHYSSPEKAREAFELSMAAETLASVEKTTWSEWASNPSGYNKTKGYKDTRGFIATSPSDGKFLAYEKSYSPTFGPVSYDSEEDAAAHVALSYEEIGYYEGMNLPSGVLQKFASPDGKGFKIDSGIGMTNLVSDDGKEFYTQLKAIDKNTGFDTLQKLNPELPKNQILRNGSVYRFDDFGGAKVYVVHNGAIFEGVSTPF